MSWRIPDIVCEDIKEALEEYGVEFDPELITKEIMTEKVEWKPWNIFCLSLKK